MALTKISGSILKDPLNLGEVSIGGTLTYQDVTNVDSVGIITARSTIDAQGDVSIADKIIHTGDTNTAIRFPAADTITAETNGTEKLRIDNAGRVFINRTAQHASSSERLSVNGMTSIQLDSTSTAGLYIFNEETTTSGNPVQPFIYLHDGSGIRSGLGVQRSTGLTILNGQFGLSLRTGSSGVGGTERLRISSSGETLVTGTLKINDGSTSANRIALGNSGDLIIYNGSNENHIYGSTNQDLIFSTNTTERLRITSGGNIGINESSPAARLHISSPG